MGGFVDPFVPAPAWPHDLVFTGSSWSGTAADSADIEFHLQNGSSSALLNGSTKQTAMSSAQLHEQFLQDDGLGFEVDSAAMERALMAGTLGSVLSTPCAMSFTGSPPVVCSSSNENDSSGSEQSGLPQFLLGENPVVPGGSDAWASAFAQFSSLVGEETSQSFGFGAVSNGDLLREACTADEKKYQQLGSVPSAPLQLHDDGEFNTGKMLSFTPGQQANADFDNLQISQKEFSSLHHLNLSSLVSGQLSSFNATGAAHSTKQVSSSKEASNGGMNAVATAPFMTRTEVPNGSGVGGNGAPKPRMRARRGQATDPHSIAERLRREKISDRMKNLQELVPNSNKTDKASMLEEIIGYVKFLQLQVKVLSMSRLGGAEAVVPLLTDSQTENSGGLLLSPRNGRQAGGGGGLLGQPELDDGEAFEQEVAQLMEDNMTTAMQFLQSKGMCLMPIALASAISDQKGASSAAVRPVDNGGGCGGKGDANAKRAVDALKRFGGGGGGPNEMRSRG